MEFTPLSMAFKRSAVRSRLYPPPGDCYKMKVLQRAFSFSPELFQGISDRLNFALNSIIKRCSCCKFSLCNRGLCGFCLTNFGLCGILFIIICGHCEPVRAQMRCPEHEVQGSTLGVQSPSCDGDSHACCRRLGITFFLT